MKKLLTMPPPRPTGILKDMKAGDVYLFKPPHDPLSIKSICSRHGKNTGRKYITQKQAGGVRVWRIK